MHNVDPRPTPPPEGGNTGDAMDAFVKVWIHVKPYVESHSFSLLGRSRRDDRLNLVYEARYFLLSLDAARCDIGDPEDVLYVKEALKNHMTAYAKLMAAAGDQA